MNTKCMREGMLVPFAKGVTTLIHGHRKRQQKRAGTAQRSVGDGILSHIVSNAVPSALTGLTAGFGMDPGVPPRL